MSHGRTFVGALVAALGLSASAHATFFSFASDANDQLPTFVGTPGSGSSFVISDAGAANRFQLLIDDNNGPLPSFGRTVRLEFNISVTHATSVPIFGSTFQHIYTIANGPGSAFAFRFVDPTDNAVLLSATFEGSTTGVFSVPGTANSWSTTGAVLGSDAFAMVRYDASAELVARMTAAGFNPEAYGVRNGASIGPDDFGFDLTVITQRSSPLGVALDPQTRVPTTGWQSEGSYSGSAVNGFIPSPSAGSLLVLSGLIALGRRRK